MSASAASTNASSLPFAASRRAAASTWERPPYVVSFHPLCFQLRSLCSSLSAASRVSWSRGISSGTT